MHSCEVGDSEVVKPHILFCCSALQISPTFLLSCAETTSTTVQKQVSQCCSQMRLLIKEQGKAMVSITCLKLVTTLQPGSTIGLSKSGVGASDADAEADQQQQQQMLNPGQSDSFMSALSAALCQSVFSVLAAAVPHLRLLTLGGFSCNAALPMFGAFCQELSHLCVDMDTVPISALCNAGQYLHSLTILTLNSTAQNRDLDQGQVIGQYVDAVFLAFKDSESLSTIQIKICKNTVLECQPFSWTLLPTSLTCMQFTCALLHSDQLTEALGRLTHLSLADGPCDAYLLDVMQNFPALMSLELTDDDPLLIHCADCAGKHGGSLIKQRLLDGSFTLRCEHLKFCGTCQQVRDMWSWFPRTVMSSGCITLFFEGGPQELCLDGLASLFPNMHWLTLAGSLDALDTPEMNVKFFEAMTDSGFSPGLGLETLELTCSQLNVSGPGLAHLCKHMTRLEHLDIEPCEDDVYNELLAELNKLGRSRNLTVTGWAQI